METGAFSGECCQNTGYVIGVMGIKVKQVDWDQIMDILGTLYTLFCERMRNTKF